MDLSDWILEEQGCWARLILNRPTSLNSFRTETFHQLKQIIMRIGKSTEVRCLVLGASGREFSSGLDISDARKLLSKARRGNGLLSRMPGKRASLRGLQDPSGCPGQERLNLLHHIDEIQGCISSLELFPWPVIACVQGRCIGAGLDLIAASDIRLCTADATFIVKEVDMAITADLGTLQRLPGIIGEGRAREMALTAREVPATEALAMGLVSRWGPLLGSTCWLCTHPGA